jgi:hypothetical protein
MDHTGQCVCGLDSWGEDTARQWTPVGKIMEFEFCKCGTHRDGRSDSWLLWEDLWYVDLEGKI